MIDRIKELEKEIALTKELIELRIKLDAPKYSTTNITNTPYITGGCITSIKGATGGLIPTQKMSGGTKFGKTDINQLDIKVGQVDMTTVNAMDSAYKKLKFGDDTKIKPQWSESSEEMWKGVKTPSYNEGRGPCECEYPAN